MAGVGEYVRALGRASQSRDGETLGRLMSLREAAPTGSAAEIGRQCGSLSGPMKQVGAGHLLAGLKLRSGDAVQAFANQLDVIKGMRQLLGSKEKGRWLLKPLAVVVRDLRELAYRADDSAGQNESTEAAMAEVREAFTACVSDRNQDVSDTLKRGALMLISSLLSISFRLNNFAIVQSYVTMIEGDRMKSLFRDQVNGFSLADRVTYKYYLGRNALFQAKYDQANDALSYAFEHCHRASQHNKRLILVYLTPVKLRLGQLPTDALLEKYNLPQFVGIAQAVRTGDLRLLQEELTTHQSFFISWGIFMTVEKLRFLAYRNLFKRVINIIVTPDAKPIVPLVDIQVALNSLQERQIDLDEVECITANLIHKKYIKGYISHAQRMLVVSKKDAFPTLKNVPAF
eukprot:m.15410 g.15410  ORF g.15410 m.15410 type:complete len:401 (+) comp4907_c0_seq1:41-1243(+)